jgi:hypothetical protein
VAQGEYACRLAFWNQVAVRKPRAMPFEHGESMRGFVSLECALCGSDQLDLGLQPRRAALRALHNRARARRGWRVAQHCMQTQNV